MSGRQQLVEAIDSFIAGYGLGSESFHAGWRCEYPDIYGLCGCEAEFRNDVIDTLLPVLSEAWREGVASGKWLIQESQRIGHWSYIGERTIPVARNPYAPEPTE